jgi:hypothetical protein
MGEPPHICRLGGYFLNREYPVAECVTAIGQGIPELVKDSYEFTVPVHGVTARVTPQEGGERRSECLAIAENLGF